MFMGKVVVMTAVADVNGAFKNAFGNVSYSKDGYYLGILELQTQIWIFAVFLRITRQKLLQEMFPSIKVNATRCKFHQYLKLPEKNRWLLEA